jgi:glutathione S-transferase
MIVDNAFEVPSERPVVYVKHECPFSMRLLLFLAETGLLSEAQVVYVVPGGDEAIRAHLSGLTGKAPSFPSVEWPGGEVWTDSGAIIDRLCAERGVDRDRLIALPLYERGVMKANSRMFQELRALRG